MGNEQIFGWWGELSPIAPIKENTRNSITFARVVSTIDGIYVIAKKRIEKSTNYTVAQRWLYNQCQYIYCIYWSAKRWEISHTNRDYLGNASIGLVHCLT